MTLKTSNRLPDYLDHMRQAIADAQTFTEGMAPADFMQDRRTQQAVVMSLIVLGEAATKVMDQYPDFSASHAEIPWRNMRGMRNRIAHGYFDINGGFKYEVQHGLTRRETPRGVS